MTTCKYANIFVGCRLVVIQRGDKNKNVCPHCNEKMRGYAYKTARRAALKRANNSCEKKGCTVNHNLECHHMRPISWGGDNSLNNLKVLCTDHHIEAHEYLGLPIR